MEKYIINDMGRKSATNVCLRYSLCEKSLIYAKIKLYIKIFVSNLNI